MSRYETFPVDRARLVWRNPGDAIGVDVRMARRLLEASPFLVAQGVVRDEASRGAAMGGDGGGRTPAAREH